MESPNSAPWEKAPAQAALSKAKHIDPVKYEAFMQKRRRQQSLPLGILGGLLGAVLGAAIWALLNAVEGLQLGFLLFAAGALISVIIYFINRIPDGLSGFTLVDLILLAVALIVLVALAYLSDALSVAGMLSGLLELAGAMSIGFIVGLGVRFFGRGISQVYGIFGAVFTLLSLLAGVLATIALYFMQETGLDFFGTASLLFSTPTVLAELLASGLTILMLLSYALAIYVGYRTAFRPISKRQRVQLMQVEAPAVEESEPPAWPTPASNDDEPPPWPTPASREAEPPAWPTPAAPAAAESAPAEPEPPAQ